MTNTPRTWEGRFNKVVSKNTDWKYCGLSPEEIFELICTIEDEAVRGTEESIRKKIEHHARMNTYEGNDAIIYKTTMREVLSLLNNN